jgi:WD40 repeat protein
MDTSRAQREAEIQAMIASLEQNPSYQKFRPSEGQYDTNETFSLRQEEDQQQQDEKQHDQQQRPNKSMVSSQIKHECSSSFIQDEQVESIANMYHIPISCTYTLTPNPTSTHSTSDRITALHVDITGSRLLTGTSHGYIHLYDFSGMTLSSPLPFKSVLIEEGQYPIQDAAFSVSSGGDRIFVATSSSQPTLLDREGNMIIQCSKGDPYVTDTAKNTGHTGPITSVSWHPLGDASNTSCCNIVLSSSGDSSIRLWDVVRDKVIFDKLTSRGQHVIRVKNKMGQRIVMGGGVTCATFSPHGREIAVGTACGSIQLWKYGGPYTRPIQAVYHAHNPIGDTTTLNTQPSIHSLVYSPNGMIVASRSMQDDTVRLWNVSTLSTQSIPFQICVDLETYHEYANCAFRPDGTMLCAGTSVEPRTRHDHKQRIPYQSHCRLKFYKVEQNPTAGPGEKIGSRNQSKDSCFHQKPILDIPIADGASIGNVLWHPKLNQIFVALSDGR